MATLTLSEARLSGILDAWRRYDSAELKCSVMCCLFGESAPSVLENQRGQAVLQHLFSSPTTVCNVALFFSQSKLLLVHGGCSIKLPPSSDSYTYTALQLDDNCPEALSQFLSGATVGVCHKELCIQEGEFASKLISGVRELVPTDKFVEVAPVLGEFLFVKDEVALTCIEKAAGLSNTVFRRFVRGLIETEMQKTNPKTLSSIREELANKLEAPNTVVGLETLDISQFAIACLTPCVMHRGTYDSQINVTEVSTQPLQRDIIVVRYGVKNCGYTAFIGRTLIVEGNVPERVKDAYRFVHSVSDAVVERLRSGTKLSDVYEGVIKHATSIDSALTAHLPKSLGFSTGLLVLEARGSISPKGTAVVADGMAFVVRITLETVPDGADGTFGLELSDTVTIKDGAAQLNTKTARKLEEILYSDIVQEGAFESSKRDLNKITRTGQSGVPLISKEAGREEKLKTLLKELHAELTAAGGKKAIVSAGEELRLQEVGRLSHGDVVPYPKESAFPPQAHSGAVYVDIEKEVVFFPICGSTAAFHVATINKVDIKLEGDQVSCTFLFHSLQEANVAYRLNRTKIFVKELSYRARRDIFTEVKIAIQGIHQRIKNRDAERRRVSAMAGGAKLNIVPNALRLPQVKIRPTATVGRQNKDCVGNLELHQNGLRFSYIGGASIDILFENVKHIIFQPAVNSIRVIYHITLKKGVEIARKSVDEVQFVADVMESSESVAIARKSYEEEIAAEEREQMRISDTNKQFMRFAQAVEKESNLKTHIPVSNFSFEGVHTKGLTTFKANREVLWAITDRPPLTQRVSEIEVVSLERVLPGGSTFDMSLIFKDYSRPVTTITTIPRSSLEAIKDWCLASRLYYMETTVNPNWKVVLKTILEDPEWDPWRPGAGWAVLNDDVGEDEEDDDDDDDDDDSTYVEESEESDETGSSFLDDEESEPDDSDEEDDESVLSWDELERRAEEQDRKRGYTSDEDDDRPRKRPRVSGPPPAHAGRKTAPRMPPTSRAVPPPRRF
ncbi:hypothetical protein TRVL_00112 [Trypanosoma vivax]|nr:hypothetical protein TRVL_00112 [Trypanosoma vivax]